MSHSIDVEMVSTLSATRDAVWRSVSTMKGVNFELHPYVHMTSPAKNQSLTPALISDEVVFRSWLLMFSLVPFDRHSLLLELVDEGQRFVENSSSWLHRRWRHERLLVDVAPDNCAVIDRLFIEPRFVLAKPLVVGVVRKLFQHRHHRLAERFGGMVPFVPRHNRD